LQLQHNYGKLEDNHMIMPMIKKVLCVDDDADDQMIVLDTIHEIDQTIEVLTALNGKEALELLDKAKDDGSLPCLIIMDINMPLMDGKQTLVQIKKDGGLDDVPVVMFTTSSSQLDVAFCEQYGVSFITKPINMRDFHTTVQKLLSFCAE
jgi:CheY-like chemotaxis protein